MEPGNYSAAVVIMPFLRRPTLSVSRESRGALKLLITSHLGSHTDNLLKSRYGVPPHGLRRTDAAKYATSSCNVNTERLVAVLAHAPLSGIEFVWLLQMSKTICSNGGERWR